MSKKTKEKNIHKIKIMGLPKGSILWPTAATSLILGLVGFIFPDAVSSFSIIFLSVFIVNLLILFFDFSRGAVVGIVGLVIAGFSLAYSFDISLPFTNLIDNGIIGGASSEFFALYGLIFLVLLFFAIVFKRSFDYFELSSNELIRKFGILGDSQRYNAPNIQIKKHINDVFESILLFGAGDLVLITSKGQEFHINNVPRINRLEKNITKILSRLDVEIRSDSSF
jgi:hypothetical protein